MVIAVGIQDDDSEPAGGDRLEDLGDIMDLVHVELQFLKRVDVCQVDTPGKIYNSEGDQGHDLV